MFWKKSFQLSMSVCEQALVLGPDRSLVYVCVHSMQLCACLQSARQCACDCVFVRARVRLRMSDVWLEPSLRCLISDRLD